MLNFRRNGFNIINKIDDWSILEIPPSVSFNNDQQNYDTENPREKLNLYQIQPKEEPKTRRALIVQPPMNQDLLNNSSMPLTSSLPISNFISHLTSKWKIITDNKETNIIPIDLFLSRASDIYQFKDISQSDAYRLFSIVTFCSIPGWFSFDNFILLASNFGEKNAILPKLISLLQSNQKTGNWIRFKFKDDPQPKSEIRVYFNPGISYGFILIKPDGEKLYIYNDYNTPFFGEFLIDDKGNRYNSWNSIIES